MLGDYILYSHIPLGYGGGKHKRPRLDLIRDNGILRSVEPGNSFDADHIRSRSLNIRTHAVQKIGQIHHMRLLGGILNDGHAFCHGSCHHHIDGCSHTDHIHINMASCQTLRRGSDQSMPDGHIGSQRPKALDMLINGTAANVAAPGKRYLRMLIFSQKSPQQIIGSPDLFDPLAVHCQTVDIACIQNHTMASRGLYHNSDALHGIQQNLRIPDIRHIFYIYRLVRHGRSRKNRKGSIFGASDLHVTHQRISAFDRILFHLSIPLLKVSVLIKI